MNDWWNDPPDEPEYDEGQEPAKDQCDTIEEYLMDVEPIEYECATPEKCPHNKEWGLCDRCDFEGDLAYDAWREKR
jgi:hypothetical protein